MRQCGATGSGAAASGTVELGVKFQEATSDTQSLARAMEAEAMHSTPQPKGPVALTVLPHHHTCYCDRVRRVCTAEGAVREGNTVEVQLSSVVGTPSSIEWYHSIKDTDDIPEEKSEQFSPSNSLLTFTKIKKVKAIEVAHGIPDFPKFNRGMLTSAHESKLFTPTLQPLYDGTAAAALMVSEVRKAENNPNTLYLTAADIGRKIIAVVVGGDGKQYVTPEIGPVEPAPPKVTCSFFPHVVLDTLHIPQFRELWIEGTLKVGEWIWARSWYFGGVKVG